MSDYRAKRNLNPSTVTCNYKEDKDYNPWDPNGIRTPGMIRILRKELKVPQKYDGPLTCLNFSKDGRLILGTISALSHFSFGSLWYYNDVSKVPSSDNCLAARTLGSGVTDAIFVENSDERIVVALSNGFVDLVRLTTIEESESDSDNGPAFLDRVNSFQNHGDLITGLSENAIKTWILTSSYDKSLILLDLKSFSFLQEYENAHGDVVMSSDASATEPNTFASASQDGLVALWDSRDAKRAQVVHDNKEVIPTAVKFSSQKSNIIAVGNILGVVSIYDQRKLNFPMYSRNLCCNSIEKMAFSSKRPNLMSVASDSYIVNVVDTDSSELNIIYKDTKSHCDFIRGLDWHPKDDTLWTSGWDRSTAVHKL